MSDPTELFLRSLFGANPDATFSVSGDPVTILGGGGGGIPVFHRGPLPTQINARRASTAPRRPANAAPGMIYEGGMAPEMWIQMQQRRNPFESRPAATPATVDATALREEGNRAMRTGNLQAALRYYTQSIEADPHDARPYTNRSLVHFRLGNYEESAKDAAEAIRIDPNFYKGYYRRGLALEALGRLPEALSVFREARSRCPENDRGTIDTCISNCQFKLAHSPATPLIAESPQRPERSAFPEVAGAVEPLLAADYSRIAELTANLASRRSCIEAHEEANKAQQQQQQKPEEAVRDAANSTNDKTVKKDEAKAEEEGGKSSPSPPSGSPQDRKGSDPDTDIEEEYLRRIRRGQEAKKLLAVATSGQLMQQAKDAETKQAELRRALKSMARSDYYKAKHERDASYETMWKTAEEVRDAIARLDEIAATESRLSAGGPQDPPSPTLGPSSASGDTPTPPSPTAASSGDTVVSTAVTDPNELERLLERRADIKKKLQRIRALSAATDAAGRRYLAALEDEIRATDELEQLVADAGSIRTALSTRAAQAGRMTLRELSDSRIKDLKDIEQAAQRIMADEHAFRKSLVEGDMLLDEEADLERQRLALERQRIRVNAELEWAKVQDEPPARLMRMSEHLKHIRDDIDAVNRRQSEVQAKIMELVERDHPELAWKSMSSGSRIMRLVKGSGLWLNLAFTDFQIVSTVAATVNSKVYHATYRGEHVALKEVSVDDETARARFQREVDIVAACNHPNIIRIKGVFFDGPFAYLLLPFYPAGSLKTLIAKKEAPLSWVVVQDLIRQIATGLAYLHERGIVHADIKPSNILLSSDGRPVISDFGIAKRRGEFGEMSDVTVTVTQTHSGGSRVAGTSAYMSPEQLAAGDNSRTSSKSDMWALGVALYELAAGNASLADSTLEAPPALALLPGQDRIELSARRVGGDEKLADALSSLLVADPEKRASAHELLAHPYFGTRAVESSARTTSLSRSDERLGALRSYIHAVRAGSRSMLISVARDRMVDSLQSTLPQFSEEDFIGPIIVVFQGEAGIDQGALTSEMLNLFYEQVIRTRHALVSSDDPTPSISGGGGGAGDDAGVGSPTSPAAAAARASSSPAAPVLFSSVRWLPAPDDQHVEESVFELLGRVLLKSIVEGRALPIQLGSALLKFLTGASVSLADLEDYDQSFADSLRRLRLLSEEDLQAADLTFCDFTPEFLAAHQDGKYTAETAVTPDNVRDYVELRVLYELVERRRRGLEAIRKGFTSCPSLSAHLSLLTASDLQLLLCGVQHVAAEAINDALEFSGFPPSSRTPAYLREVITEMSQNNRRRFLQLCTSSAALPANGALKKIKVIKTGDAARLPVGHGCVSQLDLPDYNDKTVLREKLEVALLHVSDGFHIV